MELARLSVCAFVSFGVVFATALVVGRWTLRRVAGRTPTDGLALEATVGLGVVGTGLLGLGLLHLLRPDVLLALVAGIHLAAVRWWMGDARRIWTALRGAPECGWPISLGLVAWLVPVVILSLYPPTGFDATTYHLPFARAFARTHAVPFLADVQPPIFPQLQEMLFAAGLMLGPDVVAHLLQLACTVLVGLLLLAWTPMPPTARLWAAALWFGTPHVVWMSGAAYVDLGMALQVTAAVYAWTRARGEGAARTRWWMVAGACAGFAAATKYLGLFFVTAGLGAALATAMRRRRAWPVVVFGVAAAAAAGAWYVRLYVETGNPLFPFIPHWFEPTDLIRSWDPRLAVPPEPGSPAPSSIARRLAEGLAFLVLVPWNALAHREVFARQAPLTPYYLVILPLLLPVAAARRATRPLVVLAAAYAIAWLVLTPRDLRYLLAIWPIVNLAVMDAGVAMIARRWPEAVRRPGLVLAVAAMLAAPGWAYAGYRLARQGPLPVAREAREAYLARTVPGYEAIAWLNRRHGADYTVYALYGGRLAYYADGRFRGGWSGPARYDRVLAVIADPVALDAELQGLGADYLLTVSEEPPAPRALPDTPGWRARFVVVHRGSHFVLYRRVAAQRASLPETLQSQRDGVGQPRRGADASARSSSGRAMKAVARRSDCSSSAM